MESLIPFERKADGIRAREFSGSGARFRNGDTLLARITPCLENGKTAFVSELPEDVIGHGSTEFIVLSGREGRSDNLFIYYLARDPGLREFAVQLMEGSSGRQRVPASALGRLNIALPPLPEQCAIAAILGALDDKIELNRRMNETLEAMARALFKSWFVDFEPFRDQGMEDSPLGPMPAHWTAGKLNDIASFVKGVSYRSSDLQESDVALVTLKSVARGGGYQHEGLKPYIGKYEPEQVLQLGEVIVAHTDLTQKAEVLGRAARVQAHPQFPVLVASLDLVIVRPMRQAASNEFLYSLLSRSEFQEHAYGYANGTTVLHLSPKALPEYHCVLPPPTVIEAFTTLVQPLYHDIDHNEAQSHALAIIRDTLLPKLLSGEIRVKDANKFVERVV
jgi:type I restriction enzyme S subunit